MQPMSKFSREMQVIDNKRIKDIIKSVLMLTLLLIEKISSITQFIIINNNYNIINYIFDCKSHKNLF